MKKESNNTLKKLAIVGSLFLVGTFGIGSFINSSIYKNKEKLAKQSVDMMANEIKEPQKTTAWHGFILGAIFSGIVIGSMFKEERY